LTAFLALIEFKEEKDSSQHPVFNPMKAARQASFKSAGGKASTQAP